MPQTNETLKSEEAAISGIRAVVLAGGKGTRLAPYTTIFPKPLIPIGEYAIVELILRQLISQGVCDVTLTLGHMAESIKAYFMQRPGLTSQFCLSFTQEEKPTGTAGSLAGVPGLDETFLVLNGDVLTTLDYRNLVRFHREQNAALTIAMHRHRVKIDLGVLQVDARYRIIDYREKPEAEHLISMGIYVYEPRVMKFIEPDVYLDVPRLVQRLLEVGETVVGYPNDARWLDIGRPEDYQQALREFEEHQQEFCVGFSIPRCPDFSLPGS